MEKLPPPNSRPIVSCIWIILPHWRDLRVFADALDGEVYHYRDKNGLECDAVVHLRNGKYGLVEVKLGGDKLINEGAANLLTLAGKINTEKMNEPSFMMVLTGTGDFAY